VPRRPVNLGGADSAAFLLKNRPIRLTKRAMRATRPLGGLLTLLLGLHAAAASNVERFVGLARSERGELLYREQHQVEYEDGKAMRSVSTYFDPAGKKLAELRSDYRKNPLAPTYTFLDADGTVTEAGALTADGLELRRATEHRLIETSAQMPVVLGQGLHQLVRARFDDLMRGAREVVLFGLPARLNAYTFRIERDRSPDPRLERIRIRVDNFFLALIAPSIEADYDRETRRLVRYHGLSNLYAPDGSTRTVVIQYVYEDGALAARP